MKKDLPEKGVSRPIGVVIGLIFIGISLYMLYIDLEGMINKTHVPFFKNGADIYYADSPIMFWIFGVFWIFLSIFFIEWEILISLG